jgi:F0F1-type ATP synthase assembly protein I
VNDEQQNPRNASPPPKKGRDKSNIFMAMGIEAFVAVLGGFGLGQLVDQYLGSKGYGPAFGSIIGLVGWFMHLMQVMKRYDEEP